MGRVIIPRTSVANFETPLLFLAGPILSAPNWHDHAIEILFSYDPDITIASPRRGVRESIAAYLVQGKYNFSRQRAWERHYLDRASKTGAILFWLPGEAEHSCEKVYGAMTRLELGQWMTKYTYDPSIRFCVGSDGLFSELRTIAYDLQVDAPDKEIKKTLEETCVEALRLARQ